MRAAGGLGFPFAGDSLSQRKASAPELFGIYWLAVGSGWFLGQGIAYNNFPFLWSTHQVHLCRSCRCCEGETVSSLCLCGVYLVGFGFFFYDSIWLSSAGPPCSSSLLSAAHFGLWCHCCLCCEMSFTLSQCLH